MMAAVAHPADRDSPLSGWVEVVGAQARAPASLAGRAVWTVVQGQVDRAARAEAGELV